MAVMDALLITIAIIAIRALPSLHRTTTATLNCLSNCFIEIRSRPFSDAKRHSMSNTALSIGSDRS